MQPTPFTAALPNLAAQIDDERPLISAALLDVRVTFIGNNTVNADVITQHSYDILTSRAQFEYLNKVLSRHWNREADFGLTLNLDTTVNDSQPASTPPSTPTPKRTANTLTFTERAALQDWMNEAANTNYVANESDADAARQATKDLALMVPAFPGLTITAGNIASMRKILGIEKVKPAKPAPTTPPHDIDLVALHAQVQQHHLQLDPIAGVNIAEVLSNLRNSLHELKERLDALESANN